MVANVVLYVVVALTPVVACWVILTVPRLLGPLVRRLGRTRPVAPGPPIERLAGDLRRVHRLLVEVTPGTPVVRRRATCQAYDALLVQACAAVEATHRLGELPEGTDREIERLRIEEALRSAGLAVPWIR